jgi:hypothetical protein
MVFMFNSMPSLPKHPPLNWRERGSQFLDYVLDEKNGVLHLLHNGHIHFTAFLEGTGQELITYGAVVVGKLLRGEDVQDLLPSLQDYFQAEYGIYQNGIGDTRSEYWYLMYVNALAATITRRALMHDAASVHRLKSSMDRLVALAHQVDYNFNDQGYDFMEKKPFTMRDEYRQPDTVGGYAYLMQLAYETFGEVRYQDEAELAMRKYLSFLENPWYEIPSGAMACLAVAKMNARGKSLSLERAVRFALDSDGGSLHLGQWGGQEINGLMKGWKGHTPEEASCIAYSLESLVLLPYLLPVARYDVRFAKDIAKYALHAAANARLFYIDFFTVEAQGRPDLPPVIPYEALHRQRGEHSPYATGDFYGQKSIYGGALAAWWGEIVHPTSDPYVLDLDLTKTDFLETPDESVRLFYNPHQWDVEVTVHVGNAPVNLYDTDMGAIVDRSVSGSTTLYIPKDSTRMVKLILVEK